MSNKWPDCIVPIPVVKTVSCAAYRERSRQLETEVWRLRRSMERLLLCDDVAERVKVYLRVALQEAIDD